MYKTMKVFDCQEGMPENVKKVFFELHSDRGNNCYIKQEVMPETYLDEADNGAETVVACDDYTILDAWLLENGANVGEYVLINHWW